MADPGHAPQLEPGGLSAIWVAVTGIIGVIGSAIAAGIIRTPKTEALEQSADDARREADQLRADKAMASALAPVLDRLARIEERLTALERDVKQIRAPRGRGEPA